MGWGGKDLNNEAAVLRISKKVFVQSALILLLLMIAAGIMGVIIPSGTYELVESEGRSALVPGSFQYTEAPDYPVWRWFTAPVEVGFVGG